MSRNGESCRDGSSQSGPGVLTIASPDDTLKKTPESLQPRPGRNKIEGKSLHSKESYRIRISASRSATSSRTLDREGEVARSGSNSTHA